MRRTLGFGVLALALLLTACDSAGPESTPKPRFELTTTAPVSASVQGKATLGSNLSFSEQNVFVLPVQRLGKTATIVQLAGTYQDSVTHDLSFMRLADGPLEPGTYEVASMRAATAPAAPQASRTSSLPPATGGRPPIPCTSIR